MQYGLPILREEQAAPRRSLCRARNRAAAVASPILRPTYRVHPRYRGPSAESTLGARPRNLSKSSINNYTLFETGPIDQKG